MVHDCYIKFTLYEETFLSFRIPPEHNYSTHIEKRTSPNKQNQPQHNPNRLFGCSNNGHSRKPTKKKHLIDIFLFLFCFLAKVGKRAGGFSHTNNHSHENLNFRSLVCKLPFYTKLNPSANCSHTINLFLFH